MKGETVILYMPGQEGEVPVTFEVVHTLANGRSVLIGQDRMIVAQFDGDWHWSEPIDLLDIKIVPKGKSINMVILKDWDGYFENLVRSWLPRVKNPKHKTITVTGQPFQQSALEYYTNGVNLTLCFYPALRAGFGNLSEEDINDIIELI